MLHQLDTVDAGTMDSKFECLTTSSESDKSKNSFIIT